MENESISSSFTGFKLYFLLVLILEIWIFMERILHLKNYKGYGENSHPEFCFLVYNPHRLKSRGSASLRK